MVREDIVNSQVSSELRQLSLEGYDFCEKKVLIELLEIWFYRSIIQTQLDGNMCLKILIRLKLKKLENNICLFWKHLMFFFLFFFPYFSFWFSSVYLDAFLLVLLLYFWLCSTKAEKVLIYSGMWLCKKIRVKKIIIIIIIKK